MTSLDLILTNKTGLHARPAAELTKTASKYASRTILRGNGKTADAKSIIMVLTLGLRKGDVLTVEAEGPDEAQCVNAIRELAGRNFNEQE